jgi:predicted HNH restriction endonuclease
MSERDRKEYEATKSNPAKYSEYLERKRKERKARPDYQRDRKRAWRAAHEQRAIEMRAASHAVETAINNGSLIRPAECENCHLPHDVQAHHLKGYDPKHWLDVTWLCKWCRHAIERRQAMQAAQQAAILDDTFEDLNASDYSQLGTDGAKKIHGQRSYVRRDPAVRRVVLLRAGGQCEKCNTRRDYSGFLDVHHILGAIKSDRVWNCVAVCPNCHREAHTAPNRDDINAALLKVARLFKTSGKNASVANV